MAEESDRDITIRKILVAIDASSHSSAALEAAASLAQVLGSRLQGLFVQDETWDKISRLPYASIINELTGRIDPLEREGLENYIRRLKRRLRMQLETISRKKQIRHSWKSVEGKVEDKILEAAEEADLVTIGRRGSSFPRKRKLGSSTKKIVQALDKPILILKQGLNLGAKITVLYDASSESQKSVRLGLSLAWRNDSSLVILVADNRAETLEERSRELEHRLKESTVSTTIKLLKHTDTLTFLDSVNRLETGLLILPKNQPIIEKNLEIVLHYIDSPILLMT